MKIAYLILGHKNPGHIIRLIDSLRTPGSSFILHIDKRAGEAVYSPLESYARSHDEIYLTPRYTCYWGGFGIAQATISCLCATDKLTSGFDYAILLSGQDYPIKSPAEIQGFFALNHGRQFIESFSLIRPNRWSGNGGQFQSLNRVQHIAVSFRSHVKFIPIKRTFPLGYEPHGGSQWWALSRECILYLLQFLREHPSFVRFFKFVFIPDESLFHSALSNSRFKDTIVNDDLRYIDWEHPNPNCPRTLDASDFLALQASPKLFARKFDPGCSGDLIDRIDRELILKSDRGIRKQTP
jgi:core-2/I-Branching enzyme